MFDLSIITINYNNAAGLKQTVDSVVNQSNKNFEYIIIDGNSTDKSKRIIESLEFENLKWISEEDSGIYNAMNKGIKMATGRYVLFLNSGDYLINETILNQVYFDLKDGVSFAGCNLIIDKNTKKEILKHPEKMSFSYLLRSTIYHPSTFIKKQMFDKYGLYNEENKVVSDWEFFLKTIGLNGESFQKINKELSVFNTNGISSNAMNAELIKREKETVLNRLLKSFNHDLLDKYVLDQLINPSKRIECLVTIEKSLFLRKITTFLLSIISRLVF